ncbi:MAG TPA: helix-hairpin-helix domain-containing protein [Sedimentisphaerales bacterium]|nr:helix-hairpin-helix domain-containing protein [Sedimentisphaerales bacterium]
MKHIAKQTNNVDQVAISNLLDTAKGANKIDVSAFLVIIFICFLFSAGFVIFSAGLVDNTASVELDGKININEASAVSIMRLPGIGISKAESIILYRQNCGRQKPFENCQDLMSIHGIGPKTADSVKQYIRFE